MTKINDDRKIKIELGKFKDQPECMILLTVRSWDNSKETKINQTEYEKSWFRLQDEITNQTLDYQIINNITVPEDYEEFKDQDLDNEDNKEQSSSNRNELVYLAGRLYTNSDKKWIYEQFHNVVTTDKFGNIAEKLAEIYASSRDLQEKYQTKHQKVQ